MGDFKNYCYAALLAAPWIGVQTIWATEFGILEGILKAYGLPQSLASLTWIFGPLTGFFVAPVVGASSDSCQSRFGRRRPFIITGLLLTILFSLTFAFSDSIGPTQPIKLAIAFVSFIMLDITINIMQTPLRALGSDLAPHGFQVAVQLFAAFFQGIGGCIGFLIMKNFSHAHPQELPAVFLIVMAINLFLISFVCLVVKEKQYIKRGPKPGAFSSMSNAFKGILNMDKKLAIVCAAEFFSWAALFAWWPSAESWWSENLYGGCIYDEARPSLCPIGSPGYLANDNGATAYGNSGIYANLVQAVFSVTLSSTLYFGILKKVNIPYFLCLAIGGAILIYSKIGAQSEQTGYIVTILMAIPVSALNSFPFALVGKYNEDKPANETGLQMGILNIFICMLQILTTFAVSYLTSAYGQMGIPWTLFGAGICFGIAAFFALIVVDADKDIPDIDFDYSLKYSK
ncbi:hypothetical protein HK103_005854 [Boothiomyces macroporosus]|uniref:Sucrose transporter n=1 Tax=Boothiomyces macroporosus TaxID=261099 RepID=A0AAD5UEX1_9FUNG|nr:hypothetical protein HK103_005854 [Boothiomyces macroporosus]